MIEKFYALDQQQQMMVKVGAASVLFLMIYCLIWYPLSHRVDLLKQEIISQQEMVDWITQYKDELKQLRNLQPTVKQNSNESLLTIVEQSLRQKLMGEHKGQLQQTKSDEVQVVFTKVPFDALVSWAAKLWQNSAIFVSQIAITPTERSGYVKVTVWLTKT